MHDQFFVSHILAVKSLIIVHLSSTSQYTRNNHRSPAAGHDRRAGCMQTADVRSVPKQRLDRLVVVRVEVIDLYESVLPARDEIACPLSSTLSRVTSESTAAVGAHLWTSWPLRTSGDTPTSSRSLASSGSVVPRAMQRPPAPTPSPSRRDSYCTAWSG